MKKFLHSDFEKPAPLGPGHSRYRAIGAEQADYFQHP